MALTLKQLRDHAVARSLGRPTSLPAALRRLGFVQADPLRAPARAQDLVLRHRVRGYRAGDLERRYPRLDVDESFFINHGFLARDTAALLYPRALGTGWSAERRQQAEAVLAFVRERGTVHPAEVDAHFAHGRSLNWFGGQSRTSTQLLEALHFSGRLRVARRDAGVRLYCERTAVAPPDQAAQADQADQVDQTDATLDALVDVLVQAYAPLPEAGLRRLVSMLLRTAPPWQARRAALLARTTARFPSATVEGSRWFWPDGESPASRRHRPDEALRLLAPFDPIVWDRQRFETFWGWAYRFEAYTPARKRLRGHYALPMLWRGEVLGWANLSVQNGRLRAEVGHVGGRAPRDAAYASALDDELARIEDFLLLDRA